VQRACPTGKHGPTQIVGEGMKEGAGSGEEEQDTSRPYNLQI